MTGGAGFIGSHLVEQLVQGGSEVTVLDDLSGGRLKNLARVRDQVRLLQADARRPEVAADAVQGCDVIYQLAAIVSVPRSLAEPLATLDVNVRGVLNVLEAARRAGVARMVLASSAAVYGDTGATAPRPLSPYGLEKLTGESYLRLYADLYGISAVALRFFNVFGPRQDPSSPYSGVLSLFTDRLRRDLPLQVFGDGEQTRDFIHVSDVARALRLAGAATAPGFRAVDIGRGERVTVNALIGQLGKVAACIPRVTHLAARAGDIRDSCADPAAAQEAFGFSPRTSLADGLADLWRAS